MSKLKDWLDRGEGGEWYEPYVTNRDTIGIMALTAIVSSMIVFGFWIISIS